MNIRQTELWNNLMALTESTEVFYFVDHKLDNKCYRVFSYRLASYTDFLNPDALECRGHMFEISEEGKNTQPIRLASWPSEKFFNKEENPFTMNLDLSCIQSIMVKADGSLISTFVHNNQLKLKSKTSLSSEQAIDAMKWLDLPENEKFKEELTELALKDYTINMEWCANTNRIVLAYDKPQLTVLNIRDNQSGRYVRSVIRNVRENSQELLLCSYNEIINNWIDYEFPPNTIKFVEDIPNMEGIEGFVIKLSGGQHFKVKTNWYLTRHRNKDSVNNPRQLFEAVLDEATDDLKTLFVDDKVSLKLITDMEEKIDKIYNHIVSTVEKFYTVNKHLGRKEYAILGQKELDRKEFGLAMCKYIGQEIDYKTWMKKNWKEFGLKDVDNNVE